MCCRWPSHPTISKSTEPAESAELGTNGWNDWKLQVVPVYLRFTAADCNSNRSSNNNNNSTGGNRLPIVCYTCGKPGHISRTCPRNNNKSVGASSEGKDMEPNGNPSSDIYVDFEVNKNGMIKEDKNGNISPPPPPKWMYLMFRAFLDLGATGIQGIEVPINMVVTESETYSVIIGNNLLRKVKANIDYETSIMIISWKGKEARVLVEYQLVSDAKKVEEIEEGSEKEEEEEIENEDEDEEYKEEYEELTQEIKYNHADIKDLSKITLMELSIGKLLDNQKGLIECSTEPWASPVVLVQKKNGKQQLRID
ncbi:hypothetical protein GLOIN_2v1782137 [Rhizophagus irregularis DAOM 181602=DAOM 197198]|uniref:CCHC-type domain-containing protein n=1 Tax=Rhizophagus irregularis (strain DAOM 181602 / DAOM 197198 / MUCL 43194) TaxID=747089 RepID=A0A2P4PI36_RHIID|nr:hypothetical protein GLOIN_2v1782137 [Rhizophagus irregularis DAOM 181602=DAOM 197198]POG65041.1 hypothetical protein GLOIN_2v1782137 [Rhizophagus irregularis DAOM 181602=DAOM 197198]|eukprot:XP_025171907.1 hypothetical protein GLOIN_2v1782137 [Rhizophagus irregularis DAOM 181602=DAOM 197198]